MTTETRVDRNKLAGELKALASEHLELMVPLQADLQAAQAAHAEAVEALKGATNVAGAAQVACTAEARQHERQRAPIEATLRDDVATELAEFRGWCVVQRDAFSSKASTVNADELRALRSRSGMVFHAIQEIAKLGLLPHDELDQRLSELRAEIGDGSE